MFTRLEKLRLKRLAYVAHKLAMEQIPDGIYTRSGEPQSNHWGETHALMKEALGRPVLTDGEITALSLTRCYGNYPIFHEDDPIVDKLVELFWPDGPNRDEGVWIGWEKMGTMLDEIINED